MKEETISKINKIGKIGTIIAKIMKILLIIGLVGTIIGSIAVAVLPDNLVSLKLRGEAEVNIDVSGFNVKFSDEDKEKIKDNVMDNNADMDIRGVEYNIDSVEFGESDFSLKAAADTRTINFNRLLGVMVIVVAFMVLSLVTAVWAEGLCKAFRDCSSPFDDNVINKMQNLAISLIPWAIFKSICQSFVECLFSDKLTILVGVDIGIVLVVLIILVLVKIFKYGAMLQAESDETL